MKGHVDVSDTVVLSVKDHAVKNNIVDGTVRKYTCTAEKVMFGDLQCYERIS